MDIFKWSYKDLKGIPPHIAQHKIELYITIPLGQHVRYQMNSIYATMVKQDLDKLLVARFIAIEGETTWLSPIVVVLRKLES
jgi:hypothetical protein